MLDSYNNMLKEIRQCIDSFQGEEIPRASIYAYAESDHHPSLIVREGELQRACELERIARRAIDANPNSRFGSVEEMYDEIVKAE